MSRAFVKEDGAEPPPRYSLPSRDDRGFALAAARALLAGANRGDSASAEDATGYRWGDPRLVPEIRRLREESIETRDDRLELLADRYLRAAGSPVE
jgi:hypothetical protein